MKRREPYRVTRQSVVCPVNVNGDGIVRIHGLPVCRRVMRPDGVVLQFRDRNRWRISARGTSVVEVPLAELVEALQ